MMLKGGYGDEAFVPPAKQARVGEARPDGYLLPETKSPKSTAFPNVFISTYSITLVAGDPPPKIPRVDDDPPPGEYYSLRTVPSCIK